MEADVTDLIDIRKTPARLENRLELATRSLLHPLAIGLDDALEPAWGVVA